MSAKSNEAAVPKLRFPEFNVPWAPRHGHDAFSSRKERGAAGLPLYSVTIDRGMVRRDSLDREIANDAADESNLRARKDDLVYNMMRMWQGAVGRAREDCMVSPAYVVLAPKKCTSSSFFEQWFSRSRSIYLLWAYSHGLTSDRLRLYFRDFELIPMLLPGPDEQEKLADFFSEIDARLGLLAQKIDALSSYKRAMMQRIFAQQLRFSRADGTPFPDWQEKRLGSLFDWIGTNSLSREMLTDQPQAVQNIHYGDIHGRFSARFKQGEAGAPFIRPEAMPKISDEAFCRAGDVVIADASEDYADIGKAIEIIEARPKSIVAGLHTFIARPVNDQLALGFSGYIFQTHQLRRKIMRIAQGISVLGVSKTQLSKLTIGLPHPDEQRKIADFLSSIDEKIDAAKRQAAAMANFKTSLIQQMFV